MVEAPVSLDKIRVDKEFINKIVKNVEYNEVIVKYYSRMIKEYPEMKELLLGKRDRLYDCNRFWLLDVYKLQKVKDYKRTNLCHDKFCSNCKKVKQASRMARYIPYIEPYKDNLYLLTLTAPNCDGDSLKSTIKLYYKCFRRLIRYLTGDLAIKGLEFSSWGYKGCIRSLEVTFTFNSYHPHIHAGIVLDGIHELNKNIKNTYSYNFRSGSGAPEVRKLFSDQEILIQKIWYLLINGITVNKKNIESLEIGYSCMLDKFRDSDFGELFKYMTKETTEENKIMSYDNFKDLYFGLKGVHQIQGYGCFYNIKDEDLSEEVDDIYNQLVADLREKENPLETYESPKDLLHDDEYTLISRKKIFSLLKQL
jgi:hypothetical protein